MTSVIVYNPDSGDTLKEPRIFAENQLLSKTITASHDSAGANYLIDGLTTQKWTPADTAPTVEFNAGSPDGFTNIDYIMIVGCNWASAGASCVVKRGGGQTIGTISSGLRDNQPVVLVVDSNDHTRIIFEFTASNTSLEVGEVYAGTSIKFTRNVSVGYKPGRWDFNDEISFSRTENNQFGPSSIKNQGTTERFQLNFVPTSFMETTYRDFIDTYKGKPIGFLWNKNNTDHLIYGHWSHTAPTFTNSLFSTIQMEIKGVV